MILKLYSIFATLLIIMLCLRATTYQGKSAILEKHYDRIIEKTVTKTKQTSATACSKVGCEARISLYIERISSPKTKEKTLTQIRKIK